MSFNHRLCNMSHGKTNIEDIIIDRLFKKLIRIITHNLHHLDLNSPKQFPNTLPSIVVFVSNLI